jgi:L-seryl-tRNA(Ser) seleniumtransferase
MVSIPVAALRARADAIVTSASVGSVEEMTAVPGAGSLPGVGLPSAGVVVPGDHLVALRSGHPAIVARVREQRTFLDLRAVDPADDVVLVAALRSLRSGPDR